MGTALMVLPPLAYFEELSGTDFRLIFVLNLLHGYAALPFIYIASFLFDNPGYGFTALSILMFVIDIGSPDRTEYVINPFDVHPYSAFYEVVTLSVEGAVLFVVLLFIERWVRKVDQALSSLEPEAYAEDMGQTMVKPPRGLFRDVAGSKKPKKQEETEVMMEDELVDALVRGQMAPQTRPLLLVRRLHKAYGYSEPNLVLQGLTFTVRKGECFGLLGANGAGKTTTFRILTGELLPHAGDAYIGPFSVVNETEDFQRNLGYCPQRDGLLDMLTGVETLTLFIRLRGIEMTQAYMAALLEIFRLEEIAEQQVGKYSAGNRRKLSLCVSMLGMPSVVLLDEPYAGVGSTARRRIVNYVSELQRISKISIVLTSHCLSDVEFLCNRIAILNDGRLQCLGTLTQLKEKFGKGYAITVKTFPDRKQDVVYQRDVAREVVKNFSQAELVYTYEGVLEFRMSRVRMPWSEMFTKMAKIKKRFKLLDFFISDTSLEQIFRSVTRKEAIESAAAAAAQAPQVPVAGHTIATTLGI
ncbi:hypothetical protein V5799_026289 [Amblyomma americanum]|uniref:ABC transporter domain-containing protein n=1 Tax=Amblyomma americanum TaxID=6943 RepID=A0AAQ4DJ00_AMBAM